MTGALLAMSVLTVALLGISAGVHICGIAALNPALRALDGPAYVVVKQSADRHFPALMRPLTLAGLAALLALTALAMTNGLATAAILAAVGLIAGGIALVAVVRGDLPINARMAGWAGDDPPADWRTWQARWEKYFRVRTIGTVVAFLAALGVLAGLH